VPTYDSQQNVRRKTGRWHTHQDKAKDQGKARQQDQISKINAAIPRWQNQGGNTKAAAPRQHDQGGNTKTRPMQQDQDNNNKKPSNN
jgi:hypothetical protein